MSNERLPKVLVTGASGFLGSHLSERLIELGHDVVGVDTFTPYYPRPLKEANLTALRENPYFDFREVDLSRIAILGLWNPQDRAERDVPCRVVVDDIHFE